MSWLRRNLIDAYYNYLGMYPRRIYERIKKHEHMPRADVQAVQQGYLAEQLEHAAANVPFYRNALKGKAKPSIDDFPVTTKQVIADNYEALLAENIDAGRGYMTKGSGTTGVQSRVLGDRRHLSWSLACGWRLMTFFDLPLHAPQVIFSNRVDNPSWRQRKLRKLFARLINYYGHDSYVQSDEACRSMTAMLRGIRPVALGGLPSTLAAYRHFCIKLGIEPPKGLKVVRTHGENLTQAYRETFEEWYGVPVAQRYGAREVGSLSASCEHGNFHQSCENAFFEVLREDGSIGTSGTGRILVTMLQNRVMPLVRYELGDIVTLFPDRDCECGRGLPLMGDLHGRVIETLVRPDGNFVSSTGIHERVMRMNISDFRLTQDAPDHIDMQVITTKHYNSEDDEWWRATLAEMFGEGIRADFRKVESIPLLPGGKHLQVVNMMARGKSGAENGDNGSKN